MPSCHLITNSQLPFYCYINLYQFYNAGRELITLSDSSYLILIECLKQICLLLCITAYLLEPVHIILIIQHYICKVFIFDFLQYIFTQLLRLRQNNLTSTTVPSIPGGTVSETSFTSPAFSPNIALNSFSSGVNCVSPFGATFATSISPGTTSAPIRTIPLSSRFLSNSSLTLGISLVISSLPSFVSLDSISNSSICMEVYLSSLTSLSLIIIASSKLYPSHGMKATRMFCPNASSPRLVAGPSASTSPFSTFWPALTIGF